MNIKTGTWYQSASSGLWYENAAAAGGIAMVMVNGDSFLPITKEVCEAMHEHEQRRKQWGQISYQTRELHWTGRDSFVWFFGVACAVLLLVTLYGFAVATGLIVVCPEP